MTHRTIQWLCWFGLRNGAASSDHLLDTNVISKRRKRKAHGAVVALLNGVEDEILFLSAVTLGEPQAGIELTRKQDAAKADGNCDSGSWSALDWNSVCNQW